MTARASSDIKASDTIIKTPMEGYPDTLGEVFAVLVAHFENQKSASGLVNNDPEKELSYEYVAAASSLMASHGGSSIQSSGNIMQACFSDCKNAVMTAISVYRMIETMNNANKPQGGFRIKVGIDYGEVICESDDMHGAAVDTAKLLKNTANPNEICISSQVFHLTKGLPSVHFERAHTWNKKNVPDELEIYRIVWDAAHETSLASSPMIYVRPVWKLGDQTFVDAWDDLLQSPGPFDGEFYESKTILKDKSVVFIPRQIETVISFSLAVTKLLRKKLGNIVGGTVPIQIIADIGPYGNDWKVNEENIPPMWITLRPGYLYISENAFNVIQQKTEIPGSPIHRLYGDQSFYQVALENELPIQGRKRFMYQNALVQGGLRPCFYCGDKKHHPVNCPSKNIPENTNALNKLGYASIDELNNIFYHHIIGDGGNGETQNSVKLLNEEPLGLATSGFFELTRVFQLRFFRTFWNTTSEEWNKARRYQNQSEGGLIWLAQDSLRVSELTKAESMLTSAIDRYPLDYRVYIASGFLNIDKNDLSRAEYYFAEAFSTAKTNVQKVYSLILLARLYWIAGNAARAYEKIQRALSLNIDSVDAIYLDILFKFAQGKEKLACQRLSRLVQEDRTYFVAATIDPDFAPFIGAVGETLGILLDRTRKEAQSAVNDANNEYDLSKIALGKSVINEIQLLRAEIDQLMSKDSYFGYLDVIDHCNSIISMCRNSTIHRKREIWAIIHELNKRIEHNMGFVDSYPYKSMVESYRQQLLHARDKIRHVQNIGPALSQEQLIACQSLKGELTEEWKKLESHLKRLDLLLKLYKGSLRFLRWSGIFMAIVWFLDLFLFPLIIYYLNAFLSGFDISTIPNVWLYQKNFLLIGSLVGMSIALVITIKSFYRK